MFGDRRVGEPLREHSRKVKQQRPWPVACHDMLRLSRPIEGDQYDASDRLTADFGDVVLEESGRAARARELVFLTIVQ
jgi:hypothetical protein